MDVPSFCLHFTQCKIKFACKIYTLSSVGLNSVVVCLTCSESRIRAERLTFMNLFFFLQGPLKGFLEVLGKLQKKFYGKGQRMDCPIRTYLVTARSAASSGTRALKTLRSWGLEIDEALFLAGAPKGPMLEKIRPHIFFDDQMFHVEGAAEMGTVACHVPYGIAQGVVKKGTKDKETPNASK